MKDSVPVQIRLPSLHLSFGVVQKMKLLVFDIDGTLTSTNEIDEVCFIDALEHFSAFLTSVEIGRNIAMLAMVAFRKRSL